MATEFDLLTPSEAAVVAGVSVRDVNRVLDEGILPKRFYTAEGGRKIRFTGCTYVRFYFHAAKALTADERSHVIRRLSEAPTASGSDTWKVRDGFLTIDLAEFATDTEDRHSKLAEAREMVVEDPAILGGVPVLRGTRIPVYDVAASLAAGIPAERIRAAYPGLDDRLLELAAIYAEATPPRGRPRRLAAIESRLTVVSDEKVARRRRA